MYSVSAEYISAMNSSIQKHKINGNIDNRVFTSENVLKGSMTLTNQCSDSSDLSVGGVYIGTLKFTLLSSLGFSRGSWKGRTITLNHSQMINESANTWETIPVGKFTISEVNHSEKGIEITAYDNMSKLDLPYPGLTTSGKVYDILTFICSKCGVQLANTRAEVEAMPNGTSLLGIYPDNNCSTWRDLAHYAAQVVGGFLTADRDGKIILRRFGNQSNFTVDTYKRLTGSKFSDFVTNYTSLMVDNISNKSVRTVNILPDNGGLVNLGANPLLQYGTEDVVLSMLDNILREINEIKYTPFSSSMVGNPAFDLGDIISYTGGTAGTESSCCLMSYVWKFGQSYSVNGFGKNPSIANAQSRAEKAASGASASSKTDVVQYFTYENSEAFNIGDDSLHLVADLNIINNKSTIVESWVELKTTVNAPCVMTVTYKIDDIEDQYKPVMTFNDSGVYTVNFLRAWTISDVQQHTLKVYISVSSGSISLPVGTVNMCVKGQGLKVDDKWNGRLAYSDEFTSSALNGVIGMSDNASLATQIPIIAGDIEETFEDISINGVNDMSDNMILTMLFDAYDRCLEDGAPRITEEGENRINERQE